MLNVLRKKENMRLILWVICVIVVVTFVFFGVSDPVPGRGAASRYAGSIFGRKISHEDYAKSYRACYNQALLLYGSELPKVVEHLNLKSQAWERLILIKEADNRRLSVADNEVRSKIMDVFGGEENFDKERYEIILANYFNTSPRAFEDEMRDSLKISKLFEAVVANMTVSDDEIMEIYKAENEKVKVVYAGVEPAAFMDKITPDDSQVEEYYRQNKKQFQTQPKVNVAYLAATVDESIKKAQVSFEEIENYYEANKESFVAVTEKEADAPQYKPLTEVKNEIEALLKKELAKELSLDQIIVIEQQISDGMSLREAAEKNNATIKETGLFSAVESIPEIGWNFQFLQAAFNLEKGEISNVVEMPDGYYILQLTDKKDSYVPEYSEAKDNVKKAYIAAEAVELARNAALEYQIDFSHHLAEGSNFKEIAASLGLPAEETDYFSYNDYIQGLGKAPEFNRAAFALQEKQISEVVPTPKGFAFLTLVDKIPIDEEKFAQEREEFSQKALQMKESEIFQAWFRGLLEKASLESNI